MDEVIEKPKKAKLVQVRVLSATPQAALVEWEDAKGEEKNARGSTLKRSTIPAEALQNDRVDAGALDAGIPYGLPWEDVKFSQPSAEQLANALRYAGIWTKQDLFSHPQAAVGALQSVYSVDLGELIRFADKEK